MTIWDKLTKVVFGLLCVAMVLLVFFSYLPLVKQNQAVRGQVLRLQQQLEAEQETQKKLQTTIREMQNDPKMVERMARERMGLAKPGETIIRFEEPTTNGVEKRP